jgi:hypothetical protein
LIDGESFNDGTASDGIAMPRRVCEDPRRKPVMPVSVTVGLELAKALAVAAFHGLAVLRGGMIAMAERSAMASWHLRVSQVPSAVTLAMS